MPVPTSIRVTTVYDSMPYDLQAPTEAFAQAFVDEARSRYPSLEVRLHVVKGDAATEITAAPTSAVLTVVGTHGRSGLARLFLGSVSAAVLENATAVTVAVRGENFALLALFAMRRSSVSEAEVVRQRRPLVPGAQGRAGQTRRRRPTSPADAP